MVAIGEKVKQNGYELEVKRIRKLSDLVTEIGYVIRRGNRELTDGTIYVCEGENPVTKLNETLEAIINAIKRISRRTT